MQRGAGSQVGLIIIGCYNTQCRCTHAETGVTTGITLLLLHPRCRERSTAMNVSVCPSVREHISRTLELHIRSSPNFLCNVTCGCGSVLHWRRSDLCMKLFKTWSIDVVKDCQSYFAIDLPSCDLKRRQDKFTLQYILQ